MTAIRAVAFDLWGTLIADDGELWEHRIRQRGERMLGVLQDSGYASNQDALRQAYRAAWTRAESVRVTGLDVSSRQQVAFFLEALDPDVQGRLEPTALDRIGDEFAEALLISPPSATPGAAEALAACRAAGTRTALVSNTGQTPGRVLRRTLSSLGLASFIDVWVFSDEIGLSKPAPAIFRHVLGALGTRPAETLFVGDAPELDVIGARAAGLWMSELVLGARNGAGPRPHVQVADLRSFEDGLRSIGLELAPIRP